MAAMQLIKKGYQVTLVEARDRTGGRIQTVTDPFSFPVETGAEFVHGDQPVTMSLMKEASIDFHKVKGKFYSYRKGKLDNEYSDDPDWELLLTKLSALEVDETIGSFLNRNFSEEKYKDLIQNVKSFVEGYDAADINKVSALALREEWGNNEDENQYRISGGYGKLIKYLESEIIAGGAKLYLSHEVKLIQWSSNNVVVSTTNGKRIEGQKLIITLPLGVLQKGSVSFQPALPDDYTNAIQAIGFGTVTKFLFEFNASFWEQVILAKRKNLVFQFSDAEIPTWWSQSPFPFALLTGWQGGPSVLSKSRDKQNQFNKAVQSLAYLFECTSDAIEGNLIAYQITNWTDDPYSCGAYAYATVESNNARNVICEPIINTLFFAGEAFYKGPAMGTVEAALHSGSLTSDFF